jgi:hypothetical protein
LVKPAQNQIGVAPTEHGERDPLAARACVVENEAIDDAGAAIAAATRDATGVCNRSLR